MKNVFLPCPHFANVDSLTNVAKYRTCGKSFGVVVQSTADISVVPKQKSAFV